jgi:hypothetical protein
MPEGGNMAKTAVQAKPADAPVYDATISFLVADEKTASAIKSRLGGLNVFFYPHNQEELIGSNGLESMRGPFLSARVNVVLYRERYGKTPWTGVELAAIQDSCLKTGFRSLLFVQLDKKDGKPEWLPDTHIRCVLGDFTIDQVVGAIKNKVQERGGTIQRPDAMAEAKRVKAEADYHQDRERLMRDRQWIEGAIHNSLVATFAHVGDMVAQVNKEHGFQIDMGSTRYQSCVIRAGYVSLVIGWQQPIFNSVLSDEHGECYLRVAEFSGAVPIPGRREMMWQQPTLLKERRFKPDVSETRELVWIEEKAVQVASGELAERIMIILLDFIGRMNAGKVPRPSL